MILFFISLSLRAQERNPTHILLDVEESARLQPDSLRLEVSLTSTSQREADVLNMLGDVDKAIRRLGVSYRGGYYSLQKNCWWEANSLRCSGFKGALNYTFELKDAKEQIKILETVDSFKDKYGRSIEYSIAPPFWVVSEERKKEAERTLRLKILDTATELEKEIGKKLGKTCTLQRVNYQMGNVFLPVFQKEVTIRTPEPPEPKREEVNLSMRASLELVCK
ncbi:MAG: hypothetical protein ABDH29_04670 [Aquificaceae bacterium]